MNSCDSIITFNFKKPYNMNIRIYIVPNEKNIHENKIMFQPSTLTKSENKQ